MPLTFVDVHGREGHIDDDLVVSHAGNGAVTESIESFVAELEAELDSTEAVQDRLMVDSLRECPVQEIRRVDGSG